jgi:hypothetical protein
MNEARNGILWRHYRRHAVGPYIGLYMKNVEEPTKKEKGRHVAFIRDKFVTVNHTPRDNDRQVCEHNSEEDGIFFLGISLHIKVCPAPASQMHHAPVEGQREAALDIMPMTNGVDKTHCKQGTVRY